MSGAEGSAPEAPLSERLRRATRALHRELEREPFQSALFRGTLSRAGYAELLRSLHEVYHGLEKGLRARREHPAVAPLDVPELRRLNRLESDLEWIAGPGWASGLAPVPAAAAYRARLERLTRERPELLAAHCYVRYLGDLGGGQLLFRSAAELLGVDPDGRGEGLAFYDFPGIEDLDAFREAYRARLDGLPLSAAGARDVVREAVEAFRRHGRIFRELGRAGERCRGGEGDRTDEEAGVDGEVAR